MSRVIYIIFTAIPRISLEAALRSSAPGRVTMPVPGDFVIPHGVDDVWKTGDARKIKKPVGDCERKADWPRVSLPPLAVIPQLLGNPPYAAEQIPNRRHAG